MEERLGFAAIDIFPKRQLARWIDQRDGLAQIMLEAHENRIAHSPSPGTPGEGWGEGSAFSAWRSIINPYDEPEVFSDGQRTDG